MVWLLQNTNAGESAARVAAVAAVLAIIGTNAIKPESDTTPIARPKLSYHRWGTDRSSESGGFTNDGPTGFAVAKVMVDARADDILTAKQLIIATRDAINGTAGIYQGINIQCIQVVDEREQPASTVSGREKPVQRVTLDLRVAYLE